MQVRLVNEYVYPNKSQLEKALDFTSYPLRAGLGGVKVTIEKDKLVPQDPFSTISRVAILALSIICVPVIVVSIASLVLKKITMGELPARVRIKLAHEDMSHSLKLSQEHVRRVSGVEASFRPVLSENHNLQPLSFTAEVEFKSTTEAIITTLPDDLKTNWAEVAQALQHMEKVIDNFVVGDLNVTIHKNRITEQEQNDLARHFGKGPKIFQRALQMILRDFRAGFKEYPVLCKSVMNRFSKIQIRMSKIEDIIINLRVDQSS